MDASLGFGLRGASPVVYSVDSDPMDAWPAVCSVDFGLMDAWPAVYSVDSVLRDAWPDSGLQASWSEEHFVRPAS